jgi:nucleoside-diphosphate-sugar epimerase
MNLLITGICGFAGSTPACTLQDAGRIGEPRTILGMDNFSRPGGELNCHELKRRGIKLLRDALHPRDLVSLLLKQFYSNKQSGNKIFNSPADF